MLKPNVPSMNALNVARLSDAVAIAPANAPSPNAAERSPNARASTCSVSEASSGTSVLKLKPTSPTQVITTSTTRTCRSRQAKASPSRVPLSSVTVRSAATGYSSAVAHRERAPRGRRGS